MDTIFISVDFVGPNITHQEDIAFIELQGLIAEPVQLSVFVPEISTRDEYFG